MTKSLIVRMDEEKKVRLDRLARRRGKTSSQVIRELVDNYIERHDMRGYLGKLMEEMGEDMKRKGITQRDINKAIKEVREEERKKRS
jgi:predicted DNA-binding protein